MAFQEDDPVGAPEWIVTYSDMISLLVTFFVLLLSFASIAAKEEAKMKQFLRGMWGVFPADQGSAIEAPVEEVSPDRTYRMSASFEKSTRPFESVLHDLERAGLRANDERLPVDLSTSTSGIRLAFGDAERFAAGDERVGPSLVSALVRIADLVHAYPFEVVVEGHGDERFQADERFADAEALSLARAAASAAVLCRSGKLDPRRVSLTAYSAPLSSEKSEPAGANLARRIEIRLVPVAGI